MDTCQVTLMRIIWPA